MVWSAVPLLLIVDVEKGRVDAARYSREMGLIRNVGTALVGCHLARVITDRRGGAVGKPMQTVQEGVIQTRNG